jgi:DNA processing protein
LAKGIDTAALTGALEARGKVIAVIGTPIDEYYPKENKELQDYIASHHLLLSQVPFYKYKNEHFKARRYYFPERNKTMSALSEATIIVEASDRSGTLTQARACFKQKRPLFILNSCFENPDITWPHNYSKRDNVYRVQDINDIIQVLEQKQL